MRRMNYQALEERVNAQPRKYRAVIADTAAAGSFAVARALWRGIRDQAVYGIPVDLVSRLLYVIGEAVVGHPFGIVREHIYKKHVTPYRKSRIRKFVAEVAANATFYTPLYAGTLALGGADLKQIIGACGVSLATSAFIGRPYGWYMDRVRIVFGTKPADPDKTFHESTY